MKLAFFQAALLAVASKAADVSPSNLSESLASRTTTWWQCSLLPIILSALSMSDLVGLSKTIVSLSSCLASRKERKSAGVKVESAAGHCNSAWLASATQKMIWSPQCAQPKASVSKKFASSASSMEADCFTHGCRNSGSMSGWGLPAK